MGSIPGHASRTDAAPEIPPCVPPGLPAPAVGGSSKLVLPCHGGTTRWASWCRKTRVPAGLTVAGKHLICCLGIPPTKIRAKGAGWEASPRYPASSQLPRLCFLVPASCWVCVSVAWGIPRETACSHRSHIDLTETQRCTIQPHPRAGFREIWEG